MKKVHLSFPELKGASSKHLFSPKLEDIQFTII